MHWSAWIGMLPRLRIFVFSDVSGQAALEEIASSLLRNFVDALDRGYGAVSYIRFAVVDE